MTIDDFVAWQPVDLSLTVCFVVVFMITLYHAYANMSILCSVFIRGDPHDRTCDRIGIVSYQVARR